MAKNEALELDKDVSELNNFRYTTLCNLFGKDEADKIVGEDIEDDEFFDDEVQDLIDTAGEYI